MRGLLLIPAALTVALIYAACDRQAGLGSWLRLRGDLAAARVRIAETRLANQRVRAEGVALEGDAFALERAIREDLGLARSGETLLRWRRTAGTADSNPRFP